MSRLANCLVFSVLAALVALAGCSGPQQPAVVEADPTPQRGGTAVLGSITDVDTWNEYVSRQTFANTVLRRIYARLAQPRGAGGAPDAFDPSLAQSWEFSADGLSLTFVLADAAWSDGTPITAHDVRYTWEAQTSPDVPWLSASRKQAIEDVVVDSDRQVTFRFSRRYPFQLADAVEGGILPRHVFSHVPFADWASYDWSQVRIASGPFVLASHSPGEEFRLVRNAHYFDEPAWLDTVVVRIVPDAQSLLTQVRAGDLDFVDGIPPREAAKVRDDDRLNLVSYDRSGYDFIGWNAQRKPFDDPHVRRALTQAIDRDALVEDLLYGFGRISNGPLLSFWSAADSAVTAVPYDRQAASELLAARGLSVPSGDVALAGGSRPLEFELLTNAGNTTREQAIVKIQQQLAHVGIKVKVLPLEMRTMRQRVASGDFDAYLGGWVYELPDLRSVFASDAVFPKGGNVVHYASTDADRLLDAFDAAGDWADAKAAMQQLHRQIHDDQPYTFLYESRRLAVHGPRLTGVRIDVPTDPLARLEQFRRRSL